MRFAIFPIPVSAPRRFLACSLALLLVVPFGYGQSAHSGNSGKLGSGDPAARSKGSVSHKKQKTKKTGRSARKNKKPAGRAARAAAAARTALLKRAFVASTELRPMAQQLASLRMPAAYAGVTSYAHQHNGEAAAAAYLALGHAYLMDKRYPEAIASLRQARQAGVELADYADFLAAKANHDAGNEAAAEVLLRGFTERYPDSIFDDQAPEWEANTLLALGDASGAQRVLTAAIDTPAADHPGFQLAQGQVALTMGQLQIAERDFKRLLLGHPLSSEAAIARAKLTSMRVETSLTAAELRTLGDAYYKAGRYSEAAEQYHALARQSGIASGLVEIGRAHV